MTVNEAIIQAVVPIVPVCAPDVYRPDAGETPATVYCTFDYTEILGYGDDAPVYIRYLVQLHLYLPAGRSPMALKRQLRRAVLDAGFAVGPWTNASDKDTEHHVLECEWIECSEEDSDGV